MNKRLHSFAKKPFLKWYHKCSVCGTIKIWMPMVKCTDCKMYSHQLCVPTAGCQSPIVRGLAEDLTSNMVDVDLEKIPLPSNVDNCSDRHVAEEHRENSDRLTSVVQLKVQSEALRRLISDAPHAVSSTAIAIIDKPIALEEERELEERAATTLNDEDSDGNKTEVLLRQDDLINVHRNENRNLSGSNVEHLQAKTYGYDNSRSRLSAKLIDNQMPGQDDHVLEARVVSQNKNTDVRVRVEMNLRDTIAQFSSTRNVFPVEMATMLVKASTAVLPSTKEPFVTSLTTRASIYRHICRPVDAKMRGPMKELCELFPDMCELPFGGFFFGGQIYNNNRD